jgi:alanine dehydrogenase
VAEREQEGGKMLIGVVKELKNNEYRVGLTPGSVHELITRGHTVWVEQKAGASIGFSDEMYKLA